PIVWGPLFFISFVAIRAAIFSLLQRLCASLRRNETEPVKRNRDNGEDEYTARGCSGSLYLEPA
ncbi:hypothetical protein, partial [Escherichia coli]|uniref:hypothetical protein n=1 Tax=Escherichia coli TaxID=562 RepID=UPI001BC8A863